MSVDIRIEDSAWKEMLPEIEHVLERVMQAISDYARTGKVDLLLTNDEDIQKINATWRKKDSPTDVLSFPSDDEAFEASGFLGDIAISLGVMSRDAELQNKSLEEHFSHIFIHGFLHLLGYDHISEDDALEMEALEIKILAELGISDPYLASA